MCVVAANGLDQFQAIQFRHLQVGEHQIGNFQLDEGQGLPTIFGVDGGPSGMLFQQGASQVPVQRDIIHHQYRCHLFSPVFFQTPMSVECLAGMSSTPA